MSRYVLSRRAEADLSEVFVYGYRQFGIRQAETYAADMEHALLLLAANPRMGREAWGIAPGIRRHEFGSHVILYEILPEGVLILAIVHRGSVARLKLS